MDLKDYVINKINIYLVPSVPGRFSKKESFDKYGLNRVREILKSN